MAVADCNQSWPVPSAPPSGPMTIAEARNKFEALCYPLFLKSYSLTENYLLGTSTAGKRECVFYIPARDGVPGFTLSENSWEKVLKLAELTLEMNKVRGKKGFG